VSLNTPAPSGFKVRPARRGDAAGIVALLGECGATPDPQTVTWIISHPEMELMVASDALDKVVGVISLSHRPLLKLGGRAATIDELAVVKAWRRKGVGRELLKKAAERAKVLSVKRLELQTFGPTDEGLLAFFAACGFDRADVGIFRLR
jgi:N-acetylglutamate synthase-like GNAT family acetyltransferase